MLKDLIEIDRNVVNRILDKINTQDLPIETEVGIVREGMVKMLFIYEDIELLNSIISDSINEEYDLCLLGQSSALLGK